MLISNSFLALASVVPASAIASEITSALDLASGLDEDSAGPLATIATPGWRGQPNPYAAPDLAPSPHKNADVGALTLKQRRVELGCPTLCPVGSVMYCDGSPVGDSCGGDCCTQEDACKHFSGCVKKDGSCDGISSCHHARATEIENSCMGYTACVYLGETGFVGAVKDSCIGKNSCAQLALHSSEVPLMQITQSCTGYMACKGTHRIRGSITKSCNGEKACLDLAYYGTVGPITKSCNQDNACVDLSYGEDGSIESITKTCNNAKHIPCAILQDGSSSYYQFGHLTKFIHAETGEKFKRDSIEYIEDCYTKCVNDSECNGIKWKEHSGMPCRFFGGEISENKCNGRNVCITV